MVLTWYGGLTPLFLGGPQEILGVNPGPRGKFGGAYNNFQEVGWGPKNLWGWKNFSPF